MTASQGLMLESISERLMETVHAGSPTKHPAVRMETIDAAGELKIPFTSGILVGIGETQEERVASLEALAASHRRHGHIQEVILQNFVPHPQYYGAEVAEIADAGGDGARWADEQRTPSDAASNRFLPGPPRSRSTDMKRLVAETRRLMPDVGIQIPPNLADWWDDLVDAGATDLGGLSANGDHISPEHAFPSPHQVRKRLQPQRLRADRAPLRLPAVPGPRVDGAGRARRRQAQVLELHPAARVRPARASVTIDPELAPARDRARPRRGAR